MSQKFVLKGKILVFLRSAFWGDSTMAEGSAQAPLRSLRSLRSLRVLRAPPLALLRLSREPYANATERQFA